jgi:hypothetical protein
MDIHRNRPMCNAGNESGKGQPTKCLSDQIN